MKYLLAIYEDESGWASATPDDVRRIMAAYGEFGDKVEKAGVMLGGEGLQPTSTATTVRVRDGEVVTTDGPFAETREQLGGYYVLECADLDEAIGWAAQIPGALNGSVEVRPLMIYDAVTEQGSITATESASA
jgi:hypothetical protein